MKQVPFIDRKIIERIITVKEFNKDQVPLNQCPYKYGYAIPLYHGWDWAPTKKKLIERYT